MSETVILVSSANESGVNILTAIKQGGSFTTFMDVMTNQQDMSTVRDKLESPKYATYTAVLNNEQIKTVGVSIANDDVIDIKQSLAVMYIARQNSNEEIYNKVMAMYLSVGLTKEDVQTLLNHYGEYLTGIKEKNIRLHDDSLGFSEGTIFLNEFNQNSTAPEKKVSTVGMSEEYQEEPDDLLDFPIPTYTQVKNELINNNDNEEESLEAQFNRALTARIQYPDFKKVSDPYMGKPGLAYIGWAEMINLYYRGFDSRYLTGFPENNDLPIQDFEEPIYEALTALVDEAIKDSEANGITVAEGGIPKPLYNYFESLIELALIHNRVHTGAAAIIDSEDRDSDDTESDSVDTGMGRGKTLPGTGVTFTFEGQVRNHSISMKEEDTSLNNKNVKYRLSLFNFIREANHKYAFPEAIVKLLRWGQLKPRSLYLENSTSTKAEKYFDLEKFIAKEGDVDFAKLIPYVEDGADKFITRLVTLTKDLSPALVRDLMTSELKDVYSTFTPLDVIIGVELLRTFEDSDEQVLTYVDLDTLTDMVKRQRDGSKIHGLEYINGSIHVESHVYESLGIQFEYVDGKRKITNNAVQSIPLQQVLTYVINDSEHFRLQPSLKVLEMFRLAGIKIDEQLTSQVSLLNLWNILTSMMNYTEIQAYEEVVVFDNDTDAENNSQENMMRLRNLAVNQSVNQQTAIIRKAIQEYGDTIFKLNDLTLELTDYKAISKYDVPFEDYLNGMNTEETIKARQTVYTTTQTANVPTAQEALTKMQQAVQEEAKPIAQAFVIKGQTVGYLVHDAGVKLLLHVSQYEPSKYKEGEALGWAEFKTIYTHFASKNLEEIRKFNSQSINGLKLMYVDIQKLAK